MQLQQYYSHTLPSVYLIPAGGRTIYRGKEKSWGRVYWFSKVLAIPLNQDCPLKWCKGTNRTHAQDRVNCIISYKNFHMFWLRMGLKQTWRQESLKLLSSEELQCLKKPTDTNSGLVFYHLYCVPLQQHRCSHLHVYSNIKMTSLEPNVGLSNVTSSPGRGHWQMLQSEDRGSTVHL